MSTTTLDVQGVTSFSQLYSRLVPRYNRPVPKQQGTGTTMRGRAGHSRGGRPRRIEVEVFGTRPRLWLMGDMKDMAKIPTARAGEPLVIAFSNGTLLSGTWGKDGTLELRICERGKDVQIITHGGDGTPADPASSITVKAPLSWALIQGRIVRPDLG